MASSIALNSREVHMEKGPIASTLLLFTLPVLLSQLLQQIYNITDCMIVGRFCGEYGLAATGLGGLVLSVIINFFIGFSTGIGVIASHHYGAYDYEPLKKLISSVVLFGIGAGCLLSGIIMLFTEQIFSLLSCPAEVIPSAILYLRICAVGMAPSLFYNLGNSILRAVGDTRSSLYYLIYSSLLNLVLDVLLAVTAGLGLMGAAIATVLSQWFLLILMLRRLCKLNPRFSFKLGNPVIKGKEWAEVLKLSLPSGMQAVFMSISSLVLQVSINSFGSAAISGMTVFAKIEGFLYYPAFAYGIALTSFVGQNFGAKCMKRVEDSVRISLKLSVLIMVPLSLLLVFSAKPVLGFFTADEEIINNGFMAIASIFPLYFLYTINQVYLGALKGLGETTFPMICTMVSYCVFRIIWCRVLIPVFNSMMVVYLSYDVSWFIMIAMLLPMFRRIVKKREQYCILNH